MAPFLEVRGSWTVSSAARLPSPPTVTGVAGAHKAVTCAGVGSSTTAWPHWAIDHVPAGTWSASTVTVALSASSR